MSKILPFHGVRPPLDLVEEVACPPYDVISSEEAYKLSQNKIRSYLRITRPEIDLQSLNEHDPLVYPKGKENYDLFKKNGWLKKDSTPCYYIYQQSISNHTQTGIVAIASCDEYDSGIIKKHELTRSDKEEDRTKHIASIGANTEPVFFTYRHSDKIDSLINDFIKTHKYEYSFKYQDVIHTLWICSDINVIAKIKTYFEEIPCLYIADGHHRSAAASRVRKEKKESLSSHTGKEEYNYFLTACFPDNQMRILPYNRIIKDLNMDKDLFLKQIEKDFFIKETNLKFPKTSKQFCMYIDKKWYLLEAKKGSYDENDPIKSLDTSILQNNLLSPILDIKDPRTSSRIDFVGGVKPISYLEEKVDSYEYKIAFSLYPVTIDQIMKTSDQGKIMPPKSTWFEPKLLSGLFAHEF